MGHGCGDRYSSASYGNENKSRNKCKRELELPDEIRREWEY